MSHTLCHTHYVIHLFLFSIAKQCDVYFIFNRKNKKKATVLLVSFLRIRENRWPENFKETIDSFENSTNVR